MAYTKISKPTGTNYTRINTEGKQEYDQSTLTYDDPNTFYDGVNQSAWTNLAKPISIGGTFQLIPGMSIGMLIPLTYSQTETAVTTDAWININKPT